MSDANDIKKAALDYHRAHPPGKIKIASTKPLLTQRDLSLAYSPGVAAACEAIVADPAEVSRLTARGNLVAVITNGTAVLGLGPIGPLAAKPVMEGKGVLFQKFAGIDVFDIEINERDPDKLVDIIASLEPTFGGINLEDIKAPECFEVESKLRERVKIPVFHDDQHGTAIIVGVAVINALQITGKRIGDVKIAASGAGAAGIACLDMLVRLGAKPENILVNDKDGILYAGRPGLIGELQRYARDTKARKLADIVAGADIFLGVSAGGVLTQDMVKTMAEQPVILALANPTPEIQPELAKAVRPDAIIATGRSDYPNQVNNALCFPYIFRGALDVGATTINAQMEVACVHAIAELARREVSDVAERAYNYGDRSLTFGADYLIPQPFDPRLLVSVAPAVARAAMESGVATQPIADLCAYAEKLSQFVFRTTALMKPLFDRCKADPRRIVFAEGEEDVVLRAVQNVVDEGLAKPILIGRPAVIAKRIKRLGLRMRAGEHFELTNVEDDPRYSEYWTYLHKLNARRGTTPQLAKAMIRTRVSLIAAIMVARGEADGMITGLIGTYQSKLNYIRSVLPLDPGVSAPSAMTGVQNDRGAFFFIDTHAQADPSAEQLAEATLQGVLRLKMFGIKPKVALLSASNFGSHNSANAQKMRCVLEIVRAADPTDAALSETIRARIFPGSNLIGQANVFVCPNMDAANIAYNMVRFMTDGVAIGPILMGISKPAHILTPASTVRRVVNITAVACVEAQIRAQLASAPAQIDDAAAAG
ncbi:MAG: NADP-dependent malic enzyme [Gammaproteobacteria bacterium]|nr:MAG: NADP-dependent malic enzyme [Gammaproteobacteria bacterium]